MRLVGPFSAFQARPLEAASVCAPCNVCRRLIEMGTILECRYVDAHEAMVCNADWKIDANGWRQEHDMRSASVQLMGAQSSRD